MVLRVFSQVQHVLHDACGLYAVGDIGLLGLAQLALVCLRCKGYSFLDLGLVKELAVGDVNPMYQVLLLCRQDESVSHSPSPEPQSL